MKKKNIQRISALIILALIIFLFRPAYTPSISGSKSISKLVNIRVGGQNQTLLIRGKNKDKPIILFLHGGPGLAQICYARKYQSKLEDAEEIIEYLCKTYEKEKIILVGHSWGTELGMDIIKKDSSRILSYIGVGQVVDHAEGERISYEYAVDLAKQNRDNSALNDLENMGSPPYNDVINSTLEQENIIKKYSLFKHDVNVTNDVIKGSLLSPESNGLDAIKYAFGNKLSAEKLWGTNNEFNLFDEARKVDIPVYFCAGRYDYTTPSVLVRKYYETLEAPHKEFIWFDNSAHFPQYTENDKFCNLLLNISNKI